MTFNILIKILIKPKRGWFF